MVALSADPAKNTAALAARLDLAFPLLIDTELKAIRAYGVEDIRNDIALPATILVARDGTVHWAYVGDRKSDRPVVPDVLAALEHLKTAE